MDARLKELLDFVRTDTAYHVVWVGSTVAIIRRRGTGEWRSLGSMRELHSWELEHIPYFARQRKQGP